MWGSSSSSCAKLTPPPPSSPPEDDKDDEETKDEVASWLHPRFCTFVKALLTKKTKKNQWSRTIYEKACRRVAFKFLALDLDRRDTLLATLPFFKDASVPPEQWFAAETAVLQSVDFDLVSVALGTHK